MNYAFVDRDGQLGQTHEFTGQVPVISAAKGRWIPDTPPVYNTLTHNLQIPSPIPPDAEEVPYTIIPKPINEVREYRIKYLEDDRMLAQARDIVVLGASYPAKPEDRELITNLSLTVHRGDPLPTQTIKRVDGQDVTITMELLEALEAAMSAQVLEAWAHYNDLLSIVNAPDATVESVYNVVW